MGEMVERELYNMLKICETSFNQRFAPVCNLLGMGPMKITANISDVKVRFGDEGEV